MNWKRCKLIRDYKIKKITKLLVFISVSTLPFVGLTSLLGLETFLDSFETPDSYLYLENSDELVNLNFKDSVFIIVQKSDHPEFDVKESDTVVYSSLTGDISCNKIEHIHSIGPLKKYELKGNDIKQYSETIYEEQIIGKVIKITDKNILNTFSLELWTITINNLNIHSLFK